MNEEIEPFEQRLKHQPLRQVPPEWRQEILATAARNPKESRVETMDVRVHLSFFTALNHRLTSLLWPHPAAWGGLAAIWIFIFAVNFSLRDKMPAMAEKVLPPSPEVIAELRQQQRLFAELMGANDSRDADRQKIFVPRPRSERMNILTA